MNELASPPAGAGAGGRGLVYELVSSDMQVLHELVSSVGGVVDYPVSSAAQPVYEPVSSSVKVVNYKVVNYLVSSASPRGAGA
ncbi:hypothetical protein [Amycolatopsis balhimycina]|uniref:hypothetical protein n=1 Tax=Amycolatopsis balhimycina TaxID=208443 RepID=UPI000F78F65E|nr:hypothetical protein [Amycolatopsis balhimycina]